MSNNTRKKKFIEYSEYIHQSKNQSLINKDTSKRINISRVPVLNIKEKFK